MFADLGGNQNRRVIDGGVSNVEKALANRTISKYVAIQVKIEFGSFIPL